MDAKPVDQGVRDAAEAARSLVREIDVKVSQGEGRAAHGLVRGHALGVDVPVEAGGKDSGPTPLETFAFALGACFVSAASAIAAMEGVPISGISARVKGTIDISRAMGLTDQGRAGFPGLALLVACDGPLGREEKQAFLNRVLERCPVCDNIRLATPLALELP